MRKIRILITAIGGGTIGEQLLKVVRLSNLNFEVYGADVTKNCAHSKEVAKFFIVPLATASDYIDTLYRICIENGIEILIPGSEIELKLISERRDVFSANNIFLPINPNDVIQSFLDKEKTNAILYELGIKVPFAQTVTNAAQLLDLRDFPYVLKPKAGSSGSANTFIAQDMDELNIFAKYLLRQCNELQIQKYVGIPEEEYTVGVLLDMRGEVINSIVIRRHILSGLGLKMKVRNRTRNESFGPYLVISSGISQGEVLGRFSLNEMCEDIASKIHACAAINIQLRLVDGEPYIFEINPRFSGTSPLRAMMGYNEVETLVRSEVLNQPVEKYFPFKTGMILRGLSEFYIG